MKNLMYFASDFKIGLSSLLTDQLISIHDSGINVVAVAGENEQESGLAETLKQRCVNVIRINGLDYHANFRNLVKVVKNIVINNDIDIIHVQNNWQMAIAGTVKNSLRFKHKIEIVYTLHGFRNNSPIKARIAQVVIGSALFVLADHVICMTEYLRKKFRLLSYKIDLIPLGVNDEYYFPEFIAPSNNALHLIFPAQFRPGKNQDMIIRAFAAFVKDSSDISSTLTLPGNGPLMEQMKLLASELGVKDRVKFPGFLTKEAVKQLYLESNAAIVASNSETFGQSIVEPYVLGRCVISTPVGIAPEIIQNGVNGYIFNNEYDLYEILKKLAADKKVLTKIGETNYSRRDKFSWNSITRQYADSLLLY